MSSFKPCCLATGIGSVPHLEAAEAVKFAAAYFPGIPYWPQLPMKGPEEQCVNQILNPLVELGLVIRQANKYYVDTERKDWGAVLGRFYEIYMEALDGNDEAQQVFRITEENASGFYAMLNYLESAGTGRANYLKGQILGPGTGYVLNDQNGKPIYFNQQFRDVLVKTTAMLCSFQAKRLSEFGLPVILFVDDGSIAVPGGSFNSLQGNEILTELNEIYEVVHGAGAIGGYHCCYWGEWSIVFKSTVDIVSFDAYNCFASCLSYIDQMKSYLERGGVLAWGIVPTQIEKVYTETVDTLIHRIIENVDYLVHRGIDRQMLLMQSIITPSCGTGLLPMEAAARVHELTRDLAEEIRGGYNLYNI